MYPEQTDPDEVNSFCVICLLICMTPHCSGPFCSLNKPHCGGCHSVSWHRVLRSAWWKKFWLPAFYFALIWELSITGAPFIQSQVGCQSLMWSAVYYLPSAHLFENGIPFFESWAWGLGSSPWGQVIPLLAYTVKPMAGTQETLMGQMCPVAGIMSAISPYFIWPVSPQNLPATQWQS